ncbi:GNAT family N-acetyltransferase [Methylovirgula sp. 4M-Z18]|uniref:GNAT family N-acetyltransferase n=1 Tax=Methylovirgula sp. 4M-Z18 TaxID=2293567 RepID=UPI0018F7A0F0|nr:GNAT family N-acetyltransferase [Methylovirgula sp. 4M-Z18]
MQQISTPPVLETQRLVLRGHVPQDFEPLALMWSDPIVVKHISGTPSPPRDCWMRMLSYQGLWPFLGYGYWAIREKASNKYIGDLGFADFHRLIEPSIKGIPEAGWVLAPEAHGKGFATEALAAALTWLDAQDRFDRSVCLISPDNLASIRVAEKAGYSHSKTVRSNDKDAFLFSRARP